MRLHPRQRTASWAGSEPTSATAEPGSRPRSRSSGSSLRGGRGAGNACGPPPHRSRQTTLLQLQGPKTRPSTYGRHHATPNRTGLSAHQATARRRPPKRSVNMQICLCRSCRQKQQCLPHRNPPCSASSTCGWAACGSFNCRCARLWCAQASGAASLLFKQPQLARERGAWVTGAALRQTPPHTLQTAAAGPDPSAASAPDSASARCRRAGAQQGSHGNC